MQQKHSDKENGKVKCKLCYSESSSLANLKRHIINRHREDKDHYDKDINEEDLKYTCNKCGLKFLSEHLRAFHFKKEHRARDESRETSSVASVDPVSCKLCYEEFKTNSFFHSHKRIHNEDFEAFDREYSDEDLKFECLRCSKKFLSSQLLRYHAITSHSTEQNIIKDPKKFHCGLCYETFFDKRSMMKHFTNMHIEELDYLIKPVDESDLKYKCSSCDIKFITIRSQSHHELKRHGVPLRSFDRIISTTEGARILTDSFSQYRLNGRYTCPLCYCSYVDARGLDFHFEKIHKKDKELLKCSTEDLKVKCLECDLMFLEKRFMEYHMKRKHLKFLNNYYCNLCDVKFKSTERFSGHKSRYHKFEKHLFKNLKDLNFDHQCLYCQKKFPSESSLKYHLRTSHDLSKELKIQGTQCPLCRAEIEGLPNKLNNHLLKVHLSDLNNFSTLNEAKSTFDCQKCPEKYAALSSLRFHDTMKHKENTNTRKIVTDKKLKCPLCYRLFPSQKLWARHKHNVHRNEKELFSREICDTDLTEECRECLVKFVSTQSLKHHKTFAHEKRNKPRKLSLRTGLTVFKCPLCYTKYSSKENLQKHERLVHKNDKDLLLRKIEFDELVFKCKGCTLSFAREHFLEYHVARKHPELSKNYCKFCYFCPKNISHHRERVHGEFSEEDFTKEIDFKMLTFDCCLCDKKFYTENSSLFHKIVRHLDTQQTQCSLCLVDFKVTKGHTRCLKVHIETVHTIEEIKFMNKTDQEVDHPFACEKCNGKFLTKKIWQYHLQYSHKEDKRRDLQCEVCEEKFVWSGDRAKLMREHMRTKHQVNSKNNETVFNFMKIFSGL